MAAPIPIVHHPDYILPTSAGPGKYAEVAAALRASDLPILWHEPEPTPLAALTAVHAPAYVAAVLEGRLDAAAQRRIGFAVTPEVVWRSLRVSGGTWLAAQLALRHGAAINSAGGSHHAHADFGAGYCLFNDVAIAARRLLDAGEVSRIFVIDLDVHQGDGTASIFADDARVFTFSMHAADNFPVRKAVGDLDIALPSGMGDTAYLAALEAHLPDLFTRHGPDLAFYVAGVDPHASDRLGRLALSNEGLLARDRRVGNLARSAGVPLAIVMGGGYGADIREVAARHARSLLAAAEARLQS